MLLSEVKKHYGKLKFLIGGEWVDSKSTRIEPDPNPATGEVIAELPQASPEEALAAVDAAHAAFQSWKNVSMRERAYMLFTMHNKFRENTDMLCRVLVQDHGRTIEEAKGTLARVLENIESACSAAYGLVKENAGILNLAGGIDEYLFWEPLGAFLIVTPGNIPMHAWSSFVPYALAAGCTLVISPSRQDPVAAEMVNRVALEAGFPKGVINMVHGGRTINKMILDDPRIQGVGFIGMLQAARERKAEGVDVSVGWVDTHGRAETEALLTGLDVLPRRPIEYRGQVLTEFDLDLALTRRPTLILVDELAHTNAPGSRHAKRWQDVAELLDAGIHVYTTVNIQHLESLNDVVAQITGIVVRETLPDSVLEQADEVELIDLPPEDLLQRLKEGHRRRRAENFRINDMDAAGFHGAHGIKAAPDHFFPLPDYRSRSASAARRD